MENTSKLWVFYTQCGIERSIVAVKSCKRPQATKVWQSLKSYPHYGYELLECPDETELISYRFGGLEFFKHVDTEWGAKLAVYRNANWVICYYEVAQLVKI